MFSLERAFRHTGTRSWREISQHKELGECSAEADFETIAMPGGRYYIYRAVEVATGKVFSV